MESWESTQISDNNNSKEMRLDKVMLDSELKANIMNEELYLQNLPLNDSVYSIVINPDKKQCQSCEKYCENKKLW